MMHGHTYIKYSIWLLLFIVSLNTGRKETEEGEE